MRKRKLGKSTRKLTKQKEACKGEKIKLCRMAVNTVPGCSMQSEGKSVRAKFLSTGQHPHWQALDPTNHLLAASNTINHGQQAGVKNNSAARPHTQRKAACPNSPPVLLTNTHDPFPDLTFYKNHHCHQKTKPQVWHATAPVAKSRY
jgi:hypothetical protein